MEGMDRWPEFSTASALRESTKTIDDYLKKLENRLSALEHQLKFAKEDAERMQSERDTAVQELSVFTEKYAKLEESHAVFQSIDASRRLHNAFEAAEFAMNAARGLGSVRVQEDDRVDGQLVDVRIEALQQDLQDVIENTGIIASKLTDAQEENEKLHGVITKLQTDLEILQSVNIRFRNIFRNFAAQAQVNFEDTDQIMASVSGSRPSSNAGNSQSSIQVSVDPNDGTQGAPFGIEGSVNGSIHKGINQACAPAEEEILPAAFLEAIGDITPDEMAALEKAFEQV